MWRRSPAVHELYVYYKVEPAQLDAARAAFERLRAALTLQWPDLHSRLLMRPAAAGAVQTWMEIHFWPEGRCFAPSDWIEQLESHAAQFAGPGAGGRHIEVFIALG